ncbi:MAG: hypothetical protein PHE67_00780 [Campylobacterales bacterium]|nr:hypothetical protein [Campylobacterales bacterium]
MRIIKILAVITILLANAHAGMFGNVFGDPNKLSKPIKVALTEDPNTGQTAIMTRLFDNLKKDKVTMKLKDKSGKTINVSANELKLVNFEQNTTYPILDIAFPENIAFSDENVKIAINVLQPQFDRMALDGYSRFLRIKCKTYDDNRSVMYIENIYGHVYLDTNNIKTALESIGCVMTDVKNSDVNMSVGIKTCGSNIDVSMAPIYKKGNLAEFQYVDRNTTVKGSYIDDKGHSVNIGSMANSVNGNGYTANAARSTMIGLGLAEIIIDSAIRTSEKNKKPTVIIDNDDINVLISGLSSDNYYNDDEIKRTCVYASEHLNKTCDEVTKEMKSRTTFLVYDYTKKNKLYGVLDEQLQNILIKDKFIPSVSKALKKKFQMDN